MRLVRDRRLIAGFDGSITTSILYKGGDSCGIDTRCFWRRGFLVDDCRSILSCLAALVASFACSFVALAASLATFRSSCYFKRCCRFLASSSFLASFFCCLSSLASCFVASSKALVSSLSAISLKVVFTF